MNYLEETEAQRDGVTQSPPLGLVPHLLLRGLQWVLSATCRPGWQGSHLEQ